MQLAPVALAFALLSPAARASTWIVDANNGPGTDFLQISDAIAASSPGDTLLVMPGQYWNFVLDKPLNIVGQGTGPTNDALFSGATIENLPADTCTVLANLRQNGSGFGGLVIRNDLGALVIDQLKVIDHVYVQNCADVRFRRLDSEEFVWCTDSRVEIADSLLGGRAGSPCTCCAYPQGGGTGGAALAVSGGEVHVYRSSLYGGSGGYSTCWDPGGCDSDGGDGGPAIYLGTGGRLLLAGSAEQFVQGGPGGQTTCYGGYNGQPGPAIILGSGSEARISGETILGAVLNQGGTLVNPVPADPSLQGLGTPQAGVLFTLRLHGPPGASARLILGRRPILVGTPELDEEQLAPEQRVFDLGAIPAGGVASLNYPVGAGWPKGFSLVFQGRMTLLDGTIVYSNSLPLVVN